MVYHRRTDECFQWHHTYGVSVNIKQTGGGSWEWNVKENFTGATVDTKLGFQEGSLVIAHGKAKTYDLAAAEARASVENLDNNITDKKLHTVEVKRPMHTFCTSTVSSSPANICEFAGGYGYVHQFIKPDASDAKYYIVLKDLSVEPNFNETTKFTQGSAYTHFIRYIEET